MQVLLGVPEDKKKAVAGRLCEDGLCEVVIEEREIESLNKHCRVSGFVSGAESRESTNITDYRDHELGTSFRVLQFLSELCQHCSTPFCGLRNTSRAAERVRIKPLWDGSPPGGLYGYG